MPGPGLGPLAAVRSQVLRHLRAAIGAGALAALVFAASASPAACAVRAIDDSGAEITLERPAARIVSLAPHVTGQLFAIGAGARIVGTTDFADDPPPARAIPRVARAHSVDLERIAALRPDLIVVWGSGFSPAVLEALRRLGVPVYVNEPKTLDDIATSMQRLGTLTAAAGAPAAAQAFRARIEALRGRYGGRAPVRVFYQVWAQPVMTLSGRHVISEAIALCGGRNVFEALQPIAPQVGVEAVLAADPELIVTAEPGGADRGALAQWSRFPQLAAVKRRQLATLDADRINRHAPRMAEEIAVLCEKIEAVRAAR